MNQTLREVIKELQAEHPNVDILGLPVGVYRADGGIDYVGCSGAAYLFGNTLTEEEIRDYTEDQGEAPEVTLIFANN